MKPYFTVRVPGAPAPFATEWHPTTTVGPFATLDRGAFDTEEKSPSASRRRERALRGAPDARTS